MKTIRWYLALAALMCSLAGCGGGGGGTGSTAPTVNLGGTGSATTTASSTGSTVTPTDNGQPTNTTVPATTVGSQVCGQCHTNFPFDNSFAAGNASDGNSLSPTYFEPAAGGSIYNNYVSSVHFTPAAGKLANASSGQTDVVGCEGCHGPGSQHYGTGPIPYYAPGVAQCSVCHNGGGPAIASSAIVNLDLFNQTSHGNPNNDPDKFFGNGDFGTASATYFGQPEFQDAGGSIPVNKDQHIEECSVCHNPDTKASHIAKGDLPDKPQVGCANCHDPHNPSDKTRNFLGASSDTEADPSKVPNFKPYPVNNNPLGAQYGAINTNGGTWIRPRIFYDYHVGGDAANTFSGYTNQTAVGDWLRLSTERLCAACHTKGLNKFGQRAGNTLLTSTHQGDVFTQYKHSLHAAFNDVPWQEFSLLTSDPAHRPQYPYDMGGKPGQNGSSVPFDGRINGGADNFACYQCHNGIGTIDYLNGVQGGTALGDSRDAHVIWGDTTATCITCHDPHANGSGATKNIRVPKFLSYNSEFRPDNSPNGAGNARGGVNKFLDLTDIPSTAGNSVICLFCHQGRESGWTAWNKVRRNRLSLGDSTQAASNFWYQNPTQPINPTKGFTFVNDHYLAAGGLLYGRNSTEFTGKFYSDGIPAHLQQNCTGCHMSNANANSTQGGHTFLPVVQTCQQCHAGVTTFHDIFASGDWNGNGVRQTVFDELGALNVIPALDKGGPGHANPLYGTGLGGNGLFGLLNEAMWDAGIEYDPTAYPYFYKADLPHVAANVFKAFSPNSLAAAQNLQQLYFTGNVGQQAAYVHNPLYAAQILIDSLSVLGHGAGTTTAFERPGAASGGTTHAGRDYRTLNVP